MKIFVTGATGVVGRPTVKALAEAGHHVLGVARTPEKGEMVRGLGGSPVTVDLFDAEQVRDAVFGCEAIVHLATRWLPKRWRFRGQWKENDRLRREASANLVAGATDAGIKRFIQESVTFFYADGGDRWLDESADVDPCWISIESMHAGEEIANRWAAETGGHAVNLRLGSLYGPEAPSTREAGEQARMRSLAVPAGGKHYISPIHTEDAASAIVAALELPGGAYNVVDDEPMQWLEYAPMIARAVDVNMRESYPVGMPGWLYKLSHGGAASYMMRSQRVSNARLKQASGWAPKYANATEGWKHVVANADWPSWMRDLHEGRDEGPDDE
jgi:nucleoside-diphosphate-sugar epimerase